jgi:hypothetical protein
MHAKVSDYLPSLVLFAELQHWWWDGNVKYWRLSSELHKTTKCLKPIDIYRRNLPAFECSEEAVIRIIGIVIRQLAPLSSKFVILEDANVMGKCSASVTTLDHEKTCADTMSCMIPRFDWPAGIQINHIVCRLEQFYALVHTDWGLGSLSYEWSLKLHSSWIEFDKCQSDKTSCYTSCSSFFLLPSEGCPTISCTVKTPLHDVEFNLPKS